jgi:predicted nucleic acid-binding protein
VRFWDTSALVPLVTKEEQTPRMQQVIESDRNVAVSFITPVELTSTIWRRGRRFDQTLFRRSLFKIAEIEANWTMLDDFEPTIKLARQLITKYVLRTGDAIQLAAALLLVDEHPEELPFVTLDADLSRAARQEGFPVIGSH